MVSPITEAFPAIVAYGRRGAPPMIYSMGKPMDNGNEPATKADIAVLRADMNALEQRIDQKSDALRDELIEVFRDGETRLLKAFYDFAESNQKRLQDSERDTAGVKERVGLIERRVTEIEKRLNMPPSP